jgi:hypothetical protein
VPSGIECIVWQHQRVGCGVHRTFNYLRRHLGASAQRDGGGACENRTPKEFETIPLQRNLPLTHLRRPRSFGTSF